MNLLSSLNGVLSRINPDPVDIFKPDTDPDIVVRIGGERFVCGVDDKLVGVSVEYNVKGGGLCTLEWAYFQICRIGAPVTVYIGTNVFWSGTVINGNEKTWQAEPLQSVFGQIYFYDPAYTQYPFAGTVSELVNKVFAYAAAQNPALKPGTVVSSDLLIETEVNSRTLKEILDSCAEVFENSESVYGIDNTYTMFFNNLPRTDEVLVNEEDYGGEIKYTTESDNVVTVYSVFKNREVKVISEQGEEEYIYPVDFIGKVGIGQDPVSGAYYPPVANYFLYGHREERYEIDAPDMLPQTALRDAYALLRRIKPTTKIQVPYYRYAENQIPVGASIRVLTHNSLNVSLTVPIARENVPVNPSASGAVAVVQETELNDAYAAGSGGSSKISDIPEWAEQAGLVDKITEITVGYIARYNGVITVKSGAFTDVKQCVDSPLIQFFTVKNEDGFDKFDIEILTEGAIDLISMYALGNYGQAMHRGYLRAVGLKSSNKGNFYTLEIQSYGSLPVLTAQRLQEKIRAVETITLRG